MLFPLGNSFFILEVDELKTDNLEKKKSMYLTPRNFFLLLLLMLIPRIMQKLINTYVVKMYHQFWNYFFDFMLVCSTAIIIYFLLKSLDAFTRNLSEKESFLQVMLEYMKKGIIVCDTKRNVTYVNDSFSQEWNIEKVQNPIPFDKWNDHWNLYYPDGRKMDKNDFPLALALSGKEVNNLELILKHNDKFSHFFSIDGKRIFNKSGELLGAIIAINDITDRKQAESTISYMAFHDSLTGLPNRELLNKNLLQKIDHAGQLHQEFSVMFVDLDGFKMVNDTLGHAMGDLLLKQVAVRLNSCIRPVDMVSRHGGDEFIIILDEISGEETNKIAESLLQSIAVPFVLGGKEIYITLSVGISTFPLHGISAETLIKHADSAMYRAKANGKNNYVYYSSDIDDKNLNRLSMATSLRKAIENKELELHYQPKVSISKDQIVGVEALLRWKNAELGWVNPADFIPIAEETGLIVPIGEWVLRTAAEQNKKWQDAGFAPLTVSVNLSARQFVQEDLVNKVEQLLKETGLAPSCLKLEITETMAMFNMQQSIQKLKELKAIGIGISLDDFGTGFSSLKYLKEFPISELKIDRSFIRDMELNPQDASIVIAVISIAKSLNLTVVAEGVETEQQLEFLRQQQCDEIQGFLFSRPVPSHEIEAMLQNGILTYHKNVFSRGNVKNQGAELVKEII
jgi:diguanylate cyclase (GGDEF)-like protein